MATNLARLPGRSEAQVSEGSGLRTAHFRSFLQSDQTRNVNNQAVGGASSAAVTSWTAVTMNNRWNPYCGTLTALVTQASATTGTFQLRVYGYDQFGQPLVEETPVVSLAAKTNNYIYLAHCFSYVVGVEYKSTGLDVAGDKLFLGTRWDWTRTVDGTNGHWGGRNLGVPIMLRLGRRPEQDETTGRVQPAGIGALATFQTGAPGGWASFGDSQPRSAGYAKAVLSIPVIPSNGETVTIDGKVYTFKTTLTSADGDVAIGASFLTAAYNLRAAISAVGGAGTLYGANTTAHPSVRDGYGAYNTAYVPIEYRKRGAIGNTVALAETLAGTGNVWSGTTMSGGYDMPVEVLGLTVRDLTGSGSAGAITVHHSQQFAIGWNDTGWQGPVEKLHFLSASSVAQWAVTDDILVEMTVRSAENRYQ